MTSDPVVDLEAIDGARQSQGRLLGSLASLTEPQARASSELPGWSVGHVLTHLARNADSHVRMLRAALAGEVASQYEGGAEQRAADIEHGAARPVAELVDDVTASAAALDEVWAQMTPVAWAGHGRNAGGDMWPCVAMPFHRWREVELHHVDLGLSYRPADWPLAYVARELAISLELLPERLDGPAQRDVLAWLVGRAAAPGGVVLAPWQSRPDHYLRRTLGTRQG
jgi:maleylpyruvate isomerase